MDSQQPAGEGGARHEQRATSDNFFSPGKPAQARDPALTVSTSMPGAPKFAKHRIASGIGDKMDDALPPGSAGVIAIYDHAHADEVAKALNNAARSSTAQIDKASAKELKTGLEEAGAGLGG